MFLASRDVFVTVLCKVRSCVAISPCPSFRLFSLFVQARTEGLLREKKGCRLRRWTYVTRIKHDALSCFAPMLIVSLPMVGCLALHFCRLFDDIVVVGWRE